jgi:hypothetical protein
MAFVLAPDNLPKQKRFPQKNTLRAPLTLTSVFIVLVGLGRSAEPADAVIAQIYTRPFFAGVSFECHLEGCYDGHEGIDYQLGDPSTPGEFIVAALGGTATFW